VQAGRQAIEIGAMLGKYRVESELGRGGMGVVYLAVDTTLNRKIALKALHPALSADTEFTERFRREAQVIAALAHPNIVHVNNLETFEDRFLIDMEYVGGPSLHDSLHNSVCGLTRLSGYAHQILQGLAACHAEGIIHRDLKPSNVVLTKEHVVKLCDFGLATAYAENYEQAAGSPPSTGFYCGTPLYAPPELWDGSEPSAAWDLYSLGILLYEGATGAAPHVGGTPLAVLKARIQSGIPPISQRAPHISREFADLIMHLLAEEPEARPISAIEALKTLEATPEFEASKLQKLDLTVTIPKSKRLPHKSKVNKEHAAPSIRALVWLIPAIVLLILGGAFWFLNDGRISTARNAETLQQTSVELVSTDRVAEESELLTLPRTLPEAAWVVLDVDVLGIDGKDSMQGILMPGTDGASDTLIAFSDRALWRLHLNEEGDRKLGLTGDYARYLDEGATIYRQGTIQGAGVWVAQREHMTASLTLNEVRDNSEIRATISTRSTADPSASTRFFASLERAPLVQPLIFNELLPRRAAWGIDVASLLPALPRSTITPKYVADLDDAVVIDGSLEMLWTAAADDGAVVDWTLPGIPFAQNSMLSTLFSNENLCVGLRVPEGVGSDWQVSMAIVPEFGIPVSESPVYLLTALSTGESQFSCAVDKQFIEWTPTVNIESVHADGALTVEMRFSVANFVRPEVELDNARWRLNCQVSDGVSSGTPRCVARWGWPDVVKGTHGAVMHFGESIPS